MKKNFLCKHIDESPMVKTPLMNEVQMKPFVQRWGRDKKIFAQCLMPVRGPKGFRELDYDFVQTIDPNEVIEKIKKNGFNAFALVVKDTDGAVIADTSMGWNPSGRDLTKEFSDICKDKDIMFMLSVTSMNDAYRGWKHPETVSIHIKNGKDHKAGDPATHKEGEMRVSLPEGTSWEEMKKRIPFLTKEFDATVGAARDARGRGYIPLTSFHCPRSEHVDYLIELVTELAKKYDVDGMLADYIRYHHGYTDLCGCERCRTAFAEKYPKKANKIMKCKEWWDFREDNIAEYARRFNEAVKSVNDNIITGWFNLPGPRIYSRRLVAQNYSKISSQLDTVIPMTYPYLTGTHDDGWKWGKLGDLMHWYTQRNMAKRFHEYGNVPVLCVTNSVECNAEEMLKSCRGYDYGLGIALFKYYGTTDAQWYACKLYSEELMKQEIGSPAPDEETMKKILRKVYEKYPPKVAPKWYKKEKK